MVNKRKVYHVLSKKDTGWKVVKEDQNKAIRQFTTKREAVDYARKLSKKNESELVVHRKDGSIQNVDRYSPASVRSVPKFRNTINADLDQIKSAVRAVYVVPKEKNWIVTKGGEEISSSTDNINDALDFAWDIRRERGTAVIVMDNKGHVIRSSDFSDYDDFIEETNKNVL